MILKMAEKIETSSSSEEIVYAQCLFSQLSGFGDRLQRPDMSRLEQHRP
jgi:hypothetical protein